MITRTRLFVAAIGVFLCLGGLSVLAADQKQTIQFDSFTAIYHLSRDNRGLSLLTTEEAIVAQFPGAQYSGITRTIPVKFQGHSVNVKILNITDAAGTPVPYKTKSDKDGNLVITTGDPGILLSGSETIKITYQTTGVINLNGKNDEFLLNVNGRGWDQPIGRVDAILEIPNSFNALIVGKPTCYTSVGKQNFDSCSLKVSKGSDKTTVEARAMNGTAPHEALLLNTSFKTNTFTNSRTLLSKLKTPLMIGAAIFALLVFIGLIMHIFKIGEDKD